MTLSHDRYNAPFALVALATARAKGVKKQRLLGVVVFLCSVLSFTVFKGCFTRFLFKDPDKIAIFNKP